MGTQRSRTTRRVRTRDNAKPQTLFHACYKGCSPLVRTLSLSRCPSASADQAPSLAVVLQEGGGRPAVLRAPWGRHEAPLPSTDTSALRVHPSSVGPEFLENCLCEKLAITALNSISWFSFLLCFRRRTVTWTALRRKTLPFPRGRLYC